MAQFLDVDLSRLSLPPHGSPVIYISRDPLYPYNYLWQYLWHTTTLLCLLRVCRCKLGRDVPLSAVSAFSDSLPGLRGCQFWKRTQWQTPL